MHRKLTVLAVSMATALGIMAVGLTGPAAAATTPDHCGWNPANNANAQGSIAWGIIPQTYNGPDTRCTSEGRAWPVEYSTVPPLWRPASVIVRCGHFNSEWWDYIYDSDSGTRGWVQDQYVWFYGNAHRTC